MFMVVSCGLYCLEMDLLVHLQFSCIFVLALLENLGCIMWFVSHWLYYRIPWMFTFLVLLFCSMLKWCLFDLLHYYCVSPGKPNALRRLEDRVSLILPWVVTAVVASLFCRVGRDNLEDRSLSKSANDSCLVFTFNLLFGLVVLTFYVFF